VFTDDLGLDRLGRDVQRAADDLTQARRIKHRAGADNAFVWQPRGHGHLIGQDVDRVRDDDDDAGVVAKATGDVTHDVGVVSGEIET
jgi:hypothetical protein